MSTNDPVVHMVSDEEVKGSAKELFEQMKKMGGDVPKWMRVMGNCDDILVGFFSMFKAVMDDAPLDALLKWKVAYKVSEMNQCDYCVDVSKMKLDQLGIKDMPMADLEEAATDREKLALEYATSSTDHAYKMEPELMARIELEFTDEELVELTSVVGLFSFINRFNDALNVLPEAK